MNVTFLNSPHLHELNGTDRLYEISSGYSLLQFIRMDIGFFASSSKFNHFLVSVCMRIRITKSGKSREFILTKMSQIITGTKA